MASPLHAILVEVFEARPEALTYLLGVLGHEAPARLSPTTGTRTKTLTLERRVDRAFLVGSPEAPQGFLLAEIQLGIDRSKRLSWALYVELARSRYKCEGALVAITVSARVRRWIKEEVAIPSGNYGGSRQHTPVVIALDELDPTLLLHPGMPYLALLAVAGHAGAADAQEVSEKAVDLTLAQLPRHLAGEQIDAILGMVDGALRAQLERRIMERHEYRSELFRGIYQKGEAEGKAEGRAEGKAEAVVAVLSARGIPVSSVIRKRILACTDGALLDVWIQRAALVSSAAAVLDEKPRRRPAARPAARRAPR